MFFGLLRLGFHERSTFGLGRLMWKQVGHLAGRDVFYLLTHRSLFTRL